MGLFIGFPWDCSSSCTFNLLNKRHSILQYYSINVILFFSILIHLQPMGLFLGLTHGFVLGVATHEFVLGVATREFVHGVALLI